MLLGGFQMSYKSRGNWRSGICFRECLNRGQKCNHCYGINPPSEFKEINRGLENKGRRRANKKSQGQEGEKKVEAVRFIATDKSAEATFRWNSD